MPATTTTTTTTRSGRPAGRTPAPLARELRASAQPLEAANHPDALLRLPTVMALTGLGRSTLYRILAVPGGHFPPPVRLSGGTVRWRAGDVRAWLADPKPLPPVKPRSA